MLAVVEQQMLLTNCCCCSSVITVYCANPLFLFRIFLIKISVAMNTWHLQAIFYLDCIRFAKIGNDSGDPSDSRSDSTMKKTPRVRHVFHSRKSEEYTLDLDSVFFIVESLLKSLGSPELLRNYAN